MLRSFIGLLRYQQFISWILILSSVMRCLPTWTRDFKFMCFQSIEYHIFCILLLGRFAPTLFVTFHCHLYIRAWRVICEEINLYHRGLQSVPCHCTHPLILCRDQALTFRRLPHPRWCISKVTFSQIPQSQGSMTR